MSTIRYTDLDSEPHWLEPCTQLFAKCKPGQKHVVCGAPDRMGLPVQRHFLVESLGVLLAIDDNQLVAALAICSYSDEQVTLWGPVTDGSPSHQAVEKDLLSQVKSAAREGGFESIRVLVDQRNRSLHNFYLHRSMTNWKENVIFERALTDKKNASLPNFVHLARPQDHQEIAHMLKAAFPDSSYCDQPLSEHEHNGYRHYYLQDSGAIVGAAAVNIRNPLRSWLNMIAISKMQRGKGHGSRLLAGIIDLEAKTQAQTMALEVLYDNAAAIALYAGLGFRRMWSARILTGPV